MHQLGAVLHKETLVDFVTEQEVEVVQEVLGIIIGNHELKDVHLAQNIHQQVPNYHQEVLLIPLQARHIHQLVQQARNIHREVRNFHGQVRIIHQQVPDIHYQTHQHLQ